MEKQQADQSMSAQHIHTGFAKRALREQSKVAAGCMEKKARGGSGHERGQSWRMEWKIKASVVSFFFFLCYKLSLLCGVATSRTEKELLSCKLPIQCNCELK